MKMKPTKRTVRWSHRCSVGLLAVVLVGGCATEPPVPATVTISPGSATLLRLDETVQLTATVRDLEGRTIPGIAVTWRSEDESVVTVDAAGLVTAVGRDDGYTGECCDTEPDRKRTHRHDSRHREAS